MRRLADIKWRLLAGAMLVVAALGGSIALIRPALVAPDKDDDRDQAATIAGAPARVTIKNDVAVLTLSPAEQENAGVATTRLAPAPALRVTPAFGNVIDAAPLSDLSYRYAAAESDIQSAEAKLAVARAAFERATILHRDQQNISTAQLQSAEGSFEAEKAALAAARSRLAMVAANAQEAWGGVLGAALIGHAPLISDLVERRDYLVSVTAPPGVDMAAAPAAATARISGGAEVGLAFVSPAASVNPKLQGRSYFYKSPAENGLLPGMNLEVSLTVEVPEPGFVVPEAALVWQQGRAWIYLRTGTTSFERREIVPDRPAPDGGYVVADLPADVQIVVRGAQMLLSEEYRAQAPIED
jgi:hypothetical protein